MIIEFEKYFKTVHNGFYKLCLSYDRLDFTDSQGGETIEHSYFDLNKFNHFFTKKDKRKFIKEFLENK